MDWSAIYEETGDEDGDWTGFTSRLTPILENFSSRGKYTSTICYIFTINYILGVGCLGIPYAFLKSGVILGSLLIGALSAVAYMTVMWVAEAGYRDLEIRRLEDDMTPTKRGRVASGGGGGGGRGRRRSRGRTWSNNTPTATATATTDAVTANASTTPEHNDKQVSGAGGQGASSSGGVHKGYGTLTLTPSQPIEFSSLSTLIQQETLRQNTPSPTSALYSPQTNAHRKRRVSTTSDDLTGVYLGTEEEEEAEVVELVLRFLGPTAKSCYQVSVMLLMWIGLIAYTQVFVQTFIQQLWSSVPDYIPSLLFACVVVPLSCVDLAEQIDIQVVMAVLRFVSLATLVLGTLVAVCMDARDSGYSDVPVMDDHVPLCDMAGFSLMFTTAIFSQLFQHSVPGLIRPLPPQDKQNVPSIFMYALCTTGFFYLVIGISSVYYFGPKVNQAINLNFVNFYWGLQDMSILVKVFVRFMSMVVVLFPALDTVSVYPLIANTLGNNLNVSFPHTYKSLHSVLEEHTTLHLSRCETKKLATRGWRLVAALPPIVWSMFIADLSLTLQFAGLCGILVALITPSLLQYCSVLELEETKHICLSSNTHTGPGGGSGSGHSNPYVGMFSHLRYTYAILVLAVLALSACSFQIYTNM
jgi:amino acid permease